MHKHGFFHRDMKPENLLCNGPDVIKIADFPTCLLLICQLALLSPQFYLPQLNLRLPRWV